MGPVLDGAEGAAEDAEDAEDVATAGAGEVATGPSGEPPIGAPQVSHHSVSLLW